MPWEPLYPHFLWCPWLSMDLLVDGSSFLAFSWINFGNTVPWIFHGMDSVPVFLPYRGHWVEVTGAAIPVCLALRGRLENACGLIWEYGSMDFSMGWIRFLFDWMISSDK